jgi:two-component system, OmpR family, response regulator RstA
VFSCYIGAFHGYEMRSGVTMGRARPMDPQRPRVLIVEDDAELASLIGDYLKDNGLQVSVIADGADVARGIESYKPDLIILDQMLPSKDGLQICREIRPIFPGPIVFLTARSGWVDEVVGLELGADDYLGKPVEPRLLLARVRSLLRRAEVVASVPPPIPVASEHLHVDPRNRRATLGGRPLELTDAEFELLAYLHKHVGEQLTRSQLAEEVCGQHYDALDRTIDVRVARLRAKLGDDPKNPRWIKSIRGVGYLFLQPDAE